MAISPQLREHSAAVRAKNGLTFDILGDPGNVVAGRFGLVFELPAELRALYGKFGIELPKYNGDDSWTLPMPARFVLDGSGVIRSVEADPDYTRRPEPAQAVATLRRP